MENGSPGSSQLPPGVVGVAVDFDPFDSGNAGSLIEQIIPPTEAQREVWLAARLGREASLAYNEAVELSLRGPLDEARLDQLRDACQAVFEAHPALRAVFSADGAEMQVLPADMTSLPFELLDLRGLDEGARTRRLHDWRQQVVNAPFDLTMGPLFRAHLLWLADEHAVLLLSAHHLVCDGYSFGRVLADLCRACLPACLPRPRGRSMSVSSSSCVLPMVR